MISKRLHIIGGFFILFITLFSVRANQQTFANTLPTEPSMLDRLRASEDLAHTQLAQIEKPHLVGDEVLEISAPSYIVSDLTTGAPLASYRARDVRYVASLTKLMTAIIALENANLDDVVTIRDAYAQLPESKMGLYLGEEIRMRDLISGLLIMSANDAAQAIALYVGEGDYNTFVSMMNERAREIGMKNTYFSNSMGLDSENNYSTAEDLTYLVRHALQYDIITDAVAQKERRVSAVNSGAVHYLPNTNQLLWDDEITVKGFKTGSTPQAGGCLITLAQNNEGRQIITVVLGSPDRFSETKKLIQWTWRSIEWR